jgi:ATP-dependent helicase/nuclease subunit B
MRRDLRMPEAREIISSTSAERRIASAREWLSALPPFNEAIVVAAVPEAAGDLIRGIAAERGALGGLHRLTLNRLVRLLAADRMAAEGLEVAAGLGAQAIATRAVFRLADDPALRHFAPITDRPGFSRALARTLFELRANGIDQHQLLELGAPGEALAALLAQFERELTEARLVDRAGMIRFAITALNASPLPRFAGVPTLLLDVPLEGLLDADLIAALAAHAPSVMATVPAGDTRSAELLARALGATGTAIVEDEPRDSLARLRRHLFADSDPAETPLDETVAMVSAPGEMHECVEIARRIHAEARRGVRFDQIAVLLHDPERYQPYLQEAFARAGIPAHFARGTRRPEPGGRALLALLACASEDLSASRFAEYLSLAQVPERGASDDAPRMVDSEFSPVPLADDLEHAPAIDNERDDKIGDDSADVARAPWRWEKLIVDAAVIGSAARWHRRLKGLEHELARQRDLLAPEEEARAAGIDRRLRDLKHLGDVAMPTIEVLNDLPRAATWGEWLERLRSLTTLAVRDRERVFAALDELTPLAPVGPVSLDEVRIVLEERLGRLENPARERRYGMVFVAPPARARGMSFDVVIVPGLAERVFPRKHTEDPLLPDAARQRLSPFLRRQIDRAMEERFALRLAAGAARERVMFSYPRVDLDQGRPRVPSFYALEVMRAAEGRLPGFDELARRAAGEQVIRPGWPAPKNPDEAIDDAEFDLAILDRLVNRNPDETTGAAHYLLGANDYLARALRARARRWLKSWTRADGLVDPEPGAIAALARHQLAARSYSPTALQHYAECPYRFFLYAIHRLEPRDEIEAIEVIDPLTRGSIFAETQFEILSALRSREMLPVTTQNLVDAQKLLDELLEAVAARHREELAPAIERVWNDGIEEIQADLREWLRRAAFEHADWRPERFELAFGLRDREQADPASTPEPVRIGEITLRGSIDLIERDTQGRLRATDHKTGRVRAERGFIIGGGRILQPVAYALAAKSVLGEEVGSGRLYYCTAAGGYEERIVDIDDNARASIEAVTATIDGALKDAFLPAAPAAGDCNWCDYRRICGPYEERRTALKKTERIAALRALRARP